MKLTLKGLLEEMNITVQWQSEEESHVVPCFLGKGHFIFINQQEPEELKPLTLLHEIGHILIREVPECEDISLWDEELLAWCVAQKLMHLLEWRIDRRFYSWALESLETYAPTEEHLQGAYMTLLEFI